MSKQDQQRWDRRYQSEAVDWTPASLVVAFAPPARPGAVALDVACGAGRHALYLAGLGYRVEAVDISIVALGLLVQESQRRGLSEHLHPRHADLDTWRPPPDQYDLITQIAFFDRELLPYTVAAVKPGGMLIVESFNVRRLTTHPGFNPAYVLQEDELLGACPGFDILHHSNLAGDKGDRSQIVARRIHYSPIFDV